MASPLTSLVPGEVFLFLLLFARIGTAMMLLPGFGETFVNPRMRLTISLAMCVLLFPILRGQFPPLPTSVAGTALLIGGEIGVGLFIGAITRLLLSALELAGSVIAMQTGLSAAMAFNPVMAGQGSLPGVFLQITGVVLIFISNTHHVMIQALIESYQMFVPGKLPPVDDFSMAVIMALSRSFYLAIQLAAPFLVVGLVFYVGLGLLARLMPQIQVFFIAVPLQLMIGFLLLAVTLAAMMTWYLDRFNDNVIALVAGQ
ncbi:MAG: flagellar biosynthetic protein FliR [Dongiaceae bacterium]